MKTPDLDELTDGALRSDRAALGRALTLVESELPAHREFAQELLARLLPHTGKAIRLGITGPPGVGKSTLIDALGTQRTAAGQRVAVLAVDPTSGRSGGSILGDKTRMARLSRDPSAFIRPSPSQGALGGVARKSREARLVLEAAGFDVVILETVGVGQSETEVAEMVDHFLVLLQPGSGDELQGIKRGVLELADLLAVNKADGEQKPAAERTRHQHEMALHFLRPKHEAWTPEVVCVSARTEEGLEALWDRVVAHREVLQRTGLLQTERAAQDVRWMWRVVDQELTSRMRRDPRVRAVASEVEAKVSSGSLPPTAAALELLARFGVSV